MRASPQQDRPTDMWPNEHTGQSHQNTQTDQVQPYGFRGPFAYSLRCCECLAEREHSEAVHLVLTRGWKP
jgi:hypothetical protein